jgi:hypothetical protein
MKLVAGWVQGFGHVLAAREAAAAVASSHEPICGCIACRVHGGDDSALPEMIDGLGGASP